VCVVLCAVFRLIVVLFCVMCVICVLCLIVVLLPPSENPFVVKINDNNNNNNDNTQLVLSLLLTYSVAVNRNIRISKTTWLYTFTRINFICLHIRVYRCMLLRSQ
jgi:hypothetical protein